MADVKLAVTAANAKIGLDRCIDLFSTAGEVVPLTADRVVVTGAGPKMTTSDITTTELGYLDNCTGNIQYQLSLKADLLNPTFTDDITVTDDISVGGDIFVGSVREKVLNAGTTFMNVLKVSNGLTVGMATATNSATYTTDKNDVTVLASTSTGTITITLHASIQGQILIIKDTGAAATSNITITPNGGDTIDGAASLVMATNYESVTLVGDGSTGWFII